MGGSVEMVEETLKLAYGKNSEFIKDKGLLLFSLSLELVLADSLLTSRNVSVPIPRSTFLYLPGPSELFHTVKF